MRLPRDEDEFTDRILDAMRTSGPTKVVALCRAMLGSQRMPAGISRAEVLTELGEHLDMAGQHTEAGEAFRAAIADGGSTSLDARCLLVRWCLDHGDAAEGEALLQQLWAERRRDLGVCVFVGELFERRGDLSAATRWLSAGAVHAERQLDDSPLGRAPARHAPESSPRAGLHPRRPRHGSGRNSGTAPVRTGHRLIRTPAWY